MASTFSKKFVAWAGSPAIMTSTVSVSLSAVCRESIRTEASSLVSRMSPTCNIVTVSAPALVWISSTRLSTLKSTVSWSALLPNRMFACSNWLNVTSMMLPRFWMRAPVSVLTSLSSDSITFVSACVCAEASKVIRSPITSSPPASIAIATVSSTSST